MRTPRFPPTRAGPPRRSAGSAGAGNNVTVCALVQILDELDRRDLHGQEAHGARVYHLGLSDHLVSDTLAAVATRPRPAIRSGHLGNWEEIRRGRVGLVDYNRYICRDYGLGIPVVHTHTFTENADLTDGDTIYLPAGRIERSSYERLPILVKRGEMLQPLDPNDSICCAFAYLYTDSGPLPMVAARAAELSGFPGATTIPTMLCRDEQLLRRALTALIAQALDAPGGLTLDQVFGSSGNRQGRRGEAPIAVKGGFVASGTVKASLTLPLKVCGSGRSNPVTSMRPMHPRTTTCRCSVPRPCSLSLPIWTAEWEAETRCMRTGAPSAWPGTRRFPEATSGDAPPAALYGNWARGWPNCLTSHLTYVLHFSPPRSCPFCRLLNLALIVNGWTT